MIRYIINVMCYYYTTITKSVQKALYVVCYPGLDCMETKQEIYVSVMCKKIDKK